MPMRRKNNHFWNNRADFCDVPGAQALLRGSPASAGGNLPQNEKTYFLRALRDVASHRNSKAKMLPARRLLESRRLYSIVFSSPLNMTAC